MNLYELGFSFLVLLICTIFGIKYGKTSAENKELKEDIQALKNASTISTLPDHGINSMYDKYE